MDVNVSKGSGLVLSQPVSFIEWTTDSVHL